MHKEKECSNGGKLNVFAFACMLEQNSNESCGKVGFNYK